MNIDIVSQPKTFSLYGVSKVHDASKTYREDMFECMGKLWDEVREKQLPHSGTNHAVYDCGNIVFVGVELSGEPETTLEYRQVTFEKYAYCKYIGPWRELGHVYAQIQNELKQKGLRSGCPSLEIYGNGTDEESKQETEIVMSIEYQLSNV